MLPQTCRLCRTSFLNAKRTGKLFRHSHLSYITSPNFLPHNRFSVVTSIRLHKLAVRRNLLRRHIYSGLPSLPGHSDFILYPQASMLKLTHAEISSLVNSLLSSSSSV